MKQPFFSMLWTRLKKTMFAFLSPSGVTWIVITFLCYKHIFNPTFLEYSAFTVGLILTKTWKNVSAINKGINPSELMGGSNATPQG